MDLNERDKIAQRQDKEATILAEKRNRLRSAEENFKSFFKDIDKTGLTPFGELPERKTEILKTLVKLFLTNPTEYEKKKEEINELYPQFNSEEFKKSLTEMWNYEYEFYKELIKYLNTMDNDYRTLFSESYKKKTFEMARNGIFLFFEQTPDLENFLIDDVEKNVKFVCDYLAMDDFGPLLQILSMIFSEEDPSDFLRTIKTKELKEAVACLINGCYGSCARTMLALIENEHTNASSVNKDFFNERITKGKERSIEISKQLGEIEISYLSKCYSDTHAVGVADTSRLISRIKNRQFGIMFTTSYIVKQAYDEMLSDGHPIVAICGKDIIDYIFDELEIRNLNELKSWLEKNY